MDDDDDDVIEESEIAQKKKAKFEKAEKERREDEDFVLRDHRARDEDESEELNAMEIVGKCCHCQEYLHFAEALVHMVEKHPDKITRRLNCPICDMTEMFSLEEHLKVCVRQW